MISMVLNGKTKIFFQIDFFLQHPTPFLTRLIMTTMQDNLMQLSHLSASSQPCYT
jgi:hypothetical protein